MRQRYWARSMHGFPAFARARPNTAHDSLVALEASGHVSGVITQNVDDLHQRAGQRWLEPLHGELHRIRCTACGRLSDRTTFQDQLELMNAPFLNVEASLAPDGDADLDEVDLSSFRVPACSACGGVLKPDVVFFGDSVPRERVKRSLALLDESRSLLVVGSSLMVFSGYRFVRHAQSAGQPVALLTRGVSRADDVLTLKLDADCADVLSATATLLGAG